jgi:hypothetical protein
LLSIIHILTDERESARRRLMYPVPLFEKESSMANTESRDA